MTYDPDLHHRQSIRLRDFDYAGCGGYFLTLCAWERQCLFGELVDGQARLNEWGAAVRDEWLRTPTIRPQVVLDAFVIMPNHLHAILFIDDGDRQIVDDVGATRWVARPCVEVDRRRNRAAIRATQRVGPGAQIRATQRVAPTGPLPGSLGAIVGQFKSAATKRINALRGTPGCPVWQRNYYEHVIRDERDLDNIRRYIEDNPLKWAEDENYLP